MKKINTSLLILLLFLGNLSASGQSVTFASLLREMASREALARFPVPGYQSLQASSYNRQSTIKDGAGWFADSDGIGFIRTEKNGNTEEWVVMEHEGPGVITKIWAPYFYYGGLEDLEGPDIIIYLDGKPAPVIRENFFKFIQGYGSIPPPFSRRTARAGNSYLPIPFSKSCKITFSKKSFYNIINYRAYDKGTVVESFTPSLLKTNSSLLQEVAQSLQSPFRNGQGTVSVAPTVLQPGKELALSIRQPAAIRQLEIWLDPAQIAQHPEILRSLVLTAAFDRESTVWTPVGDFFGSANALNPFQTWTRNVQSNGQLSCSWVMPFRNEASIILKNLSDKPIQIQRFVVRHSPWKWDDRSMYFHSNWRGDDVLQGSTFADWNFIDIQGKGVFVGDAWTVLNPDWGWWGEGDEKIYVDEAWSRKFPTHFGTGTEDYYGWAGGDHPFKDDRFSHPYLSNITVGSATKTRQGVRGFNISTRERALDAIPFQQRLVFDMEASPGVQIRNPWDHLGYSSVVFWYGRPGAIHNRPPLPEKAVRPILKLETLDQLADDIRKNQQGIPGAIECQQLVQISRSGNIDVQIDSSVANRKSIHFNRNNFARITAQKPGDEITFLVSEQFKPGDLKVQIAKQRGFASIQFFVNGKQASDIIQLDVQDNPFPAIIDLGRHQPLNNQMNVTVRFIESPQKEDKKLIAGIDYLIIRPD